MLAKSLRYAARIRDIRNHEPGQSGQDFHRVGEIAVCRALEIKDDRQIIEFARPSTPLRSGRDDRLI